MDMRVYVCVWVYMYMHKFVRVNGILLSSLELSHTTAKILLSPKRNFSHLDFGASFCVRLA